jgi:hypothetical protein
MSKIKWLSVIVLSVALSGAAYSAGRGGGGHGGGGHGGGGRGGGGHIGGGGHGGGAHFGGMRGGGGHVGGFHGGGARFSGGARSGGARFAGSGRHAGGRAAFSRAAGGSSFRGNRAAVAPNAAGNLNRQNAGIRANAVHHALAAHAVAGALHNRNALHNPAARARIAAVAATAGLAGHNRHGGWWRHSHGGYGWVGPLFWPFAYYDLYDYAMWGYDPSLWDYGYGDIYAGVFAPYGYDALTGYLPSGAAAPSSAGANPAPNEPNELAQMCGEDSQEIAGLPIDRIQQALNPNDEQRKALDDLANASVQAAQRIKAACPNQVASTAPGRLAAMQSRLEAMISAVRLVEPPLDHFYGLLNDEQKARLTALGQDQRRGRSSGVLAQGDCGNGQAAATDWPTAELEQRLHPTDAQRASLNNLKDASAKAADMLKGTCEPDQTLTPPARLSAAGKRLDAMLQAVEIVKGSLDDLYGELTDEQKAQFESIGPGRNASQASASDDAAPSSRRTNRRHHTNVVGLVRRLIGF